MHSNLLILSTCGCQVLQKCSFSPFLLEIVAMRWQKKGDFVSNLQSLALTHLSPTSLLWSSRTQIFKSLLPSCLQETSLWGRSAGYTLTLTTACLISLVTTARRMLSLVALGHTLEAVKRNLDKVCRTSVCTTGVWGLLCDDAKSTVYLIAGRAYVHEIVATVWGSKMLSVLWQRSEQII